MKKQVKDIMKNFVQLIEAAANGKKRVLDFGEDMVFYRGEIHIIKVIGDYPGMYISEIAQRLNVTRAVISKTIKKLENRGFIIKKEVQEDKKKLSVYLTKKGDVAYRAHHQFHLENDKEIFEYLEKLTERDLLVIKEFLNKANDMTKKHI
ncbi:MAG: MarR family transcriptional regulator [Marinisporobacter sp.]|jgi:DNA-binding MarR family transcriptional regulator|nr:MarR family transcriptional regulator [Marinisporobacter sp.]